MQSVAGDDLQPAGIMRGDFLQCGDGALVALDGDDAFGAKTFERLRQQRPRQPTRSGADLDHGGAVERPTGPRNTGGQIEIEQEVLAEGFLCRQAMAADDLAQRRQVVDLRHYFAAANAGVVAASRAASAKAATRLDGSARPLPAISKAVPWSGEVRTNGRPSVTLTARSKASVLIGISAWS